MLTTSRFLPSFALLYTSILLFFFAFVDHLVLGSRWRIDRDIFTYLYEHAIRVLSSVCFWDIEIIIFSVIFLCFIVAGQLLRWSNLNLLSKKTIHKMVKRWSQHIYGKVATSHKKTLQRRKVEILSAKLNIILFYWTKEFRILKRKRVWEKERELKPILFKSRSSLMSWLSWCMHLTVWVANE